MNKFEELKYNVDALHRAIAENQKFFSPIYNFVEKLYEFMTTRLDGAKKEEIRFLAQKIEDFFSQYRPSPSLDFPYILPTETSLNDDTVREIYRLSLELDRLPPEEFETIKPKLTSGIPKKPNQGLNEATSHLDLLLMRFPVVVRQLKQRYSERETLIVKDEYDVQDLLHALLKIYFEDVRPEEYTPSYAGSASRIDFLLKKDEIVVETKMASKRLRDKLVGEQLIIDIKKYQVHPGCKTLYCLIYDPNSFIKNAPALVNDLSSKHGDLSVKVFVVPQ